MYSTEKDLSQINSRAHDVAGTVNSGGDLGTTTTEDLADKMDGYHLQVICAYRSGTGSFVSAHSNFVSVPRGFPSCIDFSKVKHVAAEHYEDMTPLDDYAKFINADTFWGDVRFVMESVLDGRLLLSPHCIRLSCQTFYRGYNSTCAMRESLPLNFMNGC